MALRKSSDDSEEFKTADEGSGSEKAPDKCKEKASYTKMAMLKKLEKITQKPAGKGELVQEKGSKIASLKEKLATKPKKSNDDAPKAHEKKKMKKKGLSSTKKAGDVKDDDHERKTGSSRESGASEGKDKADKEVMSRLAARTLDSSSERVDASDVVVRRRRPKEPDTAKESESASEVRLGRQPKEHVDETKPGEGANAQEVKPRKVPVGVPSGLGFCMGELQAKLRKSKTEGDVLETRTKVKSREDDEEKNGEKNLKRHRHLRPEGVKPTCAHSFCEPLLSRLYDGVIEREKAGSRVKLKLRNLAEQLHSLTAQHIQTGIEKTLEACKECDPDEELLKQLRDGAAQSRVDDDVTNQLADKINELRTSLSSKTVDKLIENTVGSIISANSSGERRRIGGATGGSASRKLATSSSETSVVTELRTSAVKSRIHNSRIKPRPKSAIEYGDRVRELSPEAYRLGQLGAERPRRVKRHPTSRASLHAAASEHQHLAADLDAFFASVHLGHDRSPTRGHTGQESGDESAGESEQERPDSDKEKEDLGKAKSSERKNVSESDESSSEKEQDSAKGQDSDSDEDTGKEDD